MIRVCSGWSPKGRIQYGERFLASFDPRWPKSVDLKVWVEEDSYMLRGAYRDLWAIPGARDCAYRFNNPAASGRLVMPNWKQSCRVLGYNFRFDAAKFWKQILIPQAASLEMDDGDILIWLDGDVETIAPVTISRIMHWIGDADVTFLGREPKHSELGFWAVGLNNRTRKFLRQIAEAYTSGSVLELKEWHSAFVWDHYRRLSNMSQRDLTPGLRAHVFPISPVGQWLRHDKGTRKPGGRA